MVKIPRGTHSARRFLALPLKGMPVLALAPDGDMYVQVVVETPRSNSTRSSSLLAEGSKNCPSGATQPEALGFFAKVKTTSSGNPLATSPQPRLFCPWQRKDRQAQGLYIAHAGPPKNVRLDRPARDYTSFVTFS